QPESAREAAHLGERRLALRRPRSPALRMSWPARSQSWWTSTPSNTTCSIHAGWTSFGARRPHSGRLAGPRAGLKGLGGALLIQVSDIARFRAVRPALDELEAARALGLGSRAVLHEAAASPFARSDRRPHFAGLLGRILRHPELELRVFLAPRELDEV